MLITYASDLQGAHVRYNHRASYAFSEGQSCVATTRWDGSRTWQRAMQFLAQRLRSTGSFPASSVFELQGSTARSVSGCCLKERPV